MVLCNLKVLIMEFQWHNQTRVLQWLNSSVIKPVHLKIMAKAVKQVSTIYAICFQAAIDTKPLYLDMETLLDDKDIFQAPIQLLPSIAVDHQMTLKDDT